VERLLLILLVIIAGLLPPARQLPRHRHRRPSRYRGQHRGNAAQVLLQDHQWGRHLRQMGAWRQDPEVITI
jgi:hypothetical protein